MFPSASEPSAKRSGRGFFRTTLTFSLENLVVVGMLLIMSMVVSFALGVERGKKYAGNKKARAVRSMVSRTRTRNSATANRPKERNVPVVKKKEQPAEVVVASVPLADLVEGITGNFDVNQRKNADSGKGLFTIQVASFRTEKYAQKEARDLKKKGYEIFVIPKGKHSIVCVGKFAHKEKAELFLKKLRRQYKDCLVRSL